MKPKKEKKKQSKKEFKKNFHFDRKIDLGNVLTIIALLIAFLTLRVSEKALETKVVDMEEIVNRLNQSEIERLNLETKSLNNASFSVRHTNDLWDYVFESNRQMRTIINQQFFESSLINEEMIKVIIENKPITEKQKNNLVEYLKINNLNLKINQAIENHSVQLKDFENNHAPIYDSLNVKSYNLKMPLFIKKLEKYVDSTNQILNNVVTDLTKEKNNIYIKIIRE